MTDGPPTTETVLTALGLSIADRSMNFIGRIIGEPLEDITGLIYRDALAVKRRKNIERLEDMFIVEMEQVAAPEPVTLAIAQPIFEHAANESREELLAIWAKMLSASMDPKKRSRVSRYFIDIVSKLEPTDVLLLELIHKDTSIHSAIGSDLIAQYARRFEVSMEDFQISLIFLRELTLIDSANGVVDNLLIHKGSVTLSIRGRQLMRLIST